MTTHDLEIFLDEGTPAERVIHAPVECEWEYERNPFDKEAAHYGGEDDGYYLTDWKLDGQVEVDGKPITEIPKNIYAAIENEILHLSPDDP